MTRTAAAGMALEAVCYFWPRHPQQAEAEADLVVPNGGGGISRESATRSFEGELRFEMASVRAEIVSPAESGPQVCMPKRALEILSRAL